MYGPTNEKRSSPALFLPDGSVLQFAQIFGIPGYDLQRAAAQHGLRLGSDYTLGELCLLHAPVLNPAGLDYRRLYYRIAHAVCWLKTFCGQFWVCRYRSQAERLWSRAESGSSQFP